MFFQPMGTVILSGDGWEIKRCPLSSIKRWSKAAAAEHASIAEGKTPVYWMELLVGGKQIGCIGVLVVGKVARGRGMYVIPSRRGEGWSHKLQDAKMAMIALVPGVRRVEGHTTVPYLLERHGFKVVGPGAHLPKDGYTYTLCAIDPYIRPTRSSGAQPQPHATTRIQAD
jgi:hypothetical protein